MVMDGASCASGLVHLCVWLPIASKLMGSMKPTGHHDSADVCRSTLVRIGAGAWGPSPPSCHSLQQAQPQSCMDHHE